MHAQVFASCSMTGFGNCQNKMPSETEDSTHRLTVVFIFVAVFLDMVGIGLIFPVLPNIVQVIGDMSLAKATRVSDRLFFAYTGMLILFGPLMGSLSETHGRRPMLLPSVFGFAVDYLLMAFAPMLLWLFVGRVFAGICGVSYTTANAYLACITAPEDRSKVFGYVGAAVGLDFIIGPATGDLLGEFGPRALLCVSLHCNLEFHPRLLPRPGLAIYVNLPNTVLQ
jgi:MFS transporter, DHA1 family, tetracycline resistance protein